MIQKEKKNNFENVEFEKFLFMRVVCGSKQNDFIESVRS